jgi:hypothetical protein
MRIVIDLDKESAVVDGSMKCPAIPYRCHTVINIHFYHDFPSRVSVKPAVTEFS